jgi:arabinogalactan oligomer/maltooligosaccharide transport system substrate-binding protein
MNNLRPFMAYSDVSHQTQLSLFIDGFTPFYITGPWDFRGIKRSGVNFKVTRIPPVIINGVEYYPKPYAGIKIMWVHKLSVEQGVDNAAVLFTLWFSTSKDVVITLAEEAGFVPVLADAAQDPRVTSIPEVAGVIEQLKHAILMPRSVTMAKVWGPIGNAFSLIWNEQTTVEEALNQAQMEALESISGG